MNPNEYQEIELRDLFYILLKRKWLIISLTILLMVISAAYSVYMITPQYATSTTLMLGKPANHISGDNENYTYIRVNQLLIGTYAEIAKSRTILDETIKELNLNMTVSQLKSRISVSLLNDTEIIKITTRGSDPQLIEKIANGHAKVFMQSVKEIMQLDNVTIMDKAIAPTYPISPNKKLNVAIAGVLGVMISVFIIFILEAFDNTIKINEDVKKHLDLPVIGMIPKHD